MENSTKTFDGMNKIQIAISKEQAAEAIGVSRPTIDKLIRSDETFPYYRLGKRTMFDVKALTEWSERSAFARKEILI